jgi:hypothetical protein
MMRAGNPVMLGLLRPPAGGPMRRQFMVLRFFGRKTGRRYDVPDRWPAGCEGGGYRQRGPASAG